MRHDKSTTPPAKRRAPKGSVVETSRVQYTARAKSQREFIKNTLAERPDANFPASNSGAVRQALDRLAEQWGWREGWENERPTPKRGKGGAR